MGRVSVGHVLRSSWWVLFSLFAALVSYRSHQLVGFEMRELTFRLSELEKSKHCTLAEQEDLQLRIASQHDPAWIEMVLMKELGVVPEGWLKIHFQ